MLGLTDAEFHLAVDMLIKLGVGTALAGLIGLEREMREHPAGIRTHILLVLGVILFAEASQGFAGGDPARVAAQIVTGVGFLCAGTIIRTGVDVKGLTTSASLWAASGIGVAVSLGGAYMAVAVVATLLCIMTLHLVAKLEFRFFPQSKPHTLTVILSSASALVDVISQINREAGVTVKEVTVNPSGADTEATIRIKGNPKSIIQEILILDGVRGASIK